MSMANAKRRKSAKRRLGGPYGRVLALIAVILCKGASCAVGSEAAAAQESSVPPNDARSMTLDITSGRQRTRPAITIHSLPERYKGAGHMKRRHRQIEVGPETTVASRRYVSNNTEDVPEFDVLRSLQSKSTQEEQITHSVQTTFDGANGSHGTMLDVISRGTTVNNDDPTIISIPLCTFMSTFRQRSSLMSTPAQSWSTLVSAPIGATKPSPANGPSSSTALWRLPALQNQLGFPPHCLAAAVAVLRKKLSGPLPPQPHRLLMPRRRHPFLWCPGTSKFHPVTHEPSTSICPGRI